MRRLLRGLLLVVGVVAVAAGLFTVLTGSAGMGDIGATANVESELRFYAVFWIAFGVVALRAASDVDRHALAIRGLALFMFLGGLARALAWAAEGRPDARFLVLMGLELLLPLFIVLSQRQIAGAKAD